MGIESLIYTRPLFSLYSEYAVWQELSENLSGLASLYRSEPFFRQYQNFISATYTRQMEKLGWDAVPKESSRAGTLRAKILAMMGVSHDESVLNEAYKRFMLYKEDPTRSPISGDLRIVVFSLALRHDEATVLQALKEIYEQSTFPEELRDALGVMGRVKDPSRISEVFEYSLYSGKVRFILEVSSSLSISLYLTSFLFLSTPFLGPPTRYAIRPRCLIEHDRCWCSVLLAISERKLSCDAFQVWNWPNVGISRWSILPRPANNGGSG
jgi:hypothetical protein